MIRPLEARHEDGVIVIRCSDGRVVRLNVQENATLAKATPEQLNRIECSPFGLHWPDLDEDLSLRGIMEGRAGAGPGGARSGAGRKPSGRRQYVTRLTAENIAWIKAQATERHEDECVVIERIIESARAGKVKVTTIRKFKVADSQTKHRLKDSSRKKRGVGTS